MRGAGEMLAAALAADWGCRVLAMEEEAWGSGTFVGARHRLQVEVATADALAGIEEAMFALGAHLLADLVVTPKEADGAWTIEALTIEDAEHPAFATPAGAKPARQPPWLWGPIFAGEEAGWAVRQDGASAWEGRDAERSAA